MIRHIDKWFGSEDRARGGSAPTQAPVDTTATPRASAPGIPPSAGAENLGNPFSGSLDLEGYCPPPTDKHHQQREKHYHRRRGAPEVLKESWDNHRRARRPSSATGVVSSSEDILPLAPVEGPRKICSVGRAVSTSCSPVRLRRGSMSTTASTTEVRSARHGRYGRRSSVVGTGGGRFGSGGGSEVEFARSSNTSKWGAADRGVGSERLSGGVGFFSPSRDGGRIRLLKKRASANVFQSKVCVHDRGGRSGDL